MKNPHKATGALLRERHPIEGPFRSYRYRMPHVKPLPVIKRVMKAEAKLTIDQKFQNLKAKWLMEMGTSSSLSDLFLHPAYQQIIGIGPAAVPSLLRELRWEPHLWFWALMAITGENPAAAIAPQDVDDATEAWLEWGKGILQ